MGAFNAIREPIVFPVHPRTRAVVERLGLTIAPHVLVIEPVGYLDMLMLESNARAILTDSGGVQDEYGAIERTLSFIRANVVHCEPDELIASIGMRTRAILVSHVTSPTALVLPIEEICAAARSAGVLSIVDGAHAPGQIPLDLETLGADIYAGNCHKWLCAPKGSGFLWARPEHQEWIEPLVISWGYRDGADFGERHGWQGTDVPAAYLAVPRAIEAHRSFDLEASAALADEAERRLADLRLTTMGGSPAPFMRAVQLPPGDPVALWRRLIEEHRIEVPVYQRGEQRILRVSIGQSHPHDIAITKEAPNYHM